MRFWKYTVTLLLLAMASALALQAGENQAATSKEKGKVAPKARQKINWMKFDDGLAALTADTTGKHMFIDFTAGWCGWCKKMDRETFADPEVVNALNEDFISVKVWGDSATMLDIDGYQVSEMSLARGTFGVSSYPVFYFLSPEKARIGPLRGYQTSPNLLKALTWVKDAQYDTTSANPSSTGGSDGKDKTDGDKETDTPKVKTKPKKK